jgi:hypothetical protein
MVEFNVLFFFFLVYHSLSETIHEWKDGERDAVGWEVWPNAQCDSATTPESGCRGRVAG